jgi:hypothetical protein
MFCDAVRYVMFTFWKLYILELLRCVQLRFLTLRHVTFTLCCFTFCSNIRSAVMLQGKLFSHETLAGKCETETYLIRVPWRIQAKKLLYDVKNSHWHCNKKLIIVSKNRRQKQFLRKFYFKNASFDRLWSTLTARCLSWESQTYMILLYCTCKV